MSHVPHEAIAIARVMSHRYESCHIDMSHVTHLAKRFEQMQQAGEIELERITAATISN